MRTDPKQAARVADHVTAARQYIQTGKEQGKLQKGRGNAKSSEDGATKMAESRA
jgi:surface antigen